MRFCSCRIIGPTRILASVVIERGTPTRMFAQFGFQKRRPYVSRVVYSGIAQQ